MPICHQNLFSFLRFAISSKKQCPHDPSYAFANCFPGLLEHRKTRKKFKDLRCGRTVLAGSIFVPGQKTIRYDVSNGKKRHQLDYTQTEQNRSRVGAIRTRPYSLPIRANFLLRPPSLRCRPLTFHMAVFFFRLLYFLFPCWRIRPFMFIRYASRFLAATPASLRLLNSSAVLFFVLLNLSRGLLQRLPLRHLGESDY